MTRPSDRNRLESAASPYLQQHADNPVNWQPWDDRALEAARELDRPIFLSVGYAACHWCHVMAEESFADPAIADRLNEDFVPIKVDREERPDLDSIYMTVCQQVTRGGCGWPLSVWLTPDLRPFYVGTYFPPTEKHGRPAFGDLLDSIAASWETDRAALEERAESWLAAAREELESVPVPTESDGDTDTDHLQAAGDQFIEAADRTHGGFGRNQKFPQVDRLLVLARLAARDGRADAAAVLTETLTAMLEGGLRDHLGGGFHRYCVDRDWTVPHFEKMLYDNAEIPRALLAGHALTGREEYADVAAEAFEFLDIELTDPDGAFYSTIDARSRPASGDDEDAVEGAYYTWTPEQVRTAMDRSGPDAGAWDPVFLASVFSERFGVTEGGNFEGATVLTISRSIEAIAAERDRSRGEIEDALSEAVDRARQDREERPWPPRDEKLLADWNGLMIHALAAGALRIDEPEYADRATGALEFVREHHWNGSTLSHRLKDGDRLEVDYLSDYAFLARGALALHGVTGELDPLAFALSLGRTMVERFWDPAEGVLYVTPTDAEALPIRPTTAQEQSTPSSTAVAVEVLSALDHVDPDAGFGSIAETVLSRHRDRLESHPERHPTLAAVADTVESGHLEVAIAADEVPEAWRSLLGERLIPDLLLTRRPPDEESLSRWLDELGLDEAPPIWAGREATDGPTAYVCRRSCSPPVTMADELATWLEEYAGDGHSSPPQP